MFAVLSIVVGLVFVLTLFSMLTSTVLEMIDALVSLRGRHLRRTLSNMLSEDADYFFKHPIFRQLSYAGHDSRRLSANQLPNWINKETFTAIMVDILKVKDMVQVAERIKAMENGENKRLLEFLVNESDGTIESFRRTLGHWFDQIMQRATDWYKYKSKWWLFFLGLGLASAFNADTIQVYRHLSLNAASRDQLALFAEEFAQRDSVPSLVLGEKSVEQTQAEWEEIRQTYINVVQTPLGMGWGEQANTFSMQWWLMKLAGLILTALAVTLGAPFWFDLLKKMVSLRSIQAPARMLETPVVKPEPETGSTEKKADTWSSFLGKPAMVSPAPADPSGTFESEEEIVG